MLLIHQGGKVPDNFEEQGCNGLTGDILPILDKLDPAITTVISGHTHQAYACTLQRGGAARLLTSAGKYGFLYTDVRLSFDPATHRLLGERAVNVPVTGAAGVEPQVAALVDRYVAAAKPAAGRVVGHLAGPAAKTLENGEVAGRGPDRRCAACRHQGARPRRAPTFPSSTPAARAPTSSPAPTEASPMANFRARAVRQYAGRRTLTGAQLKALLEQQFEGRDGKAQLRASTLVPSANFHFAFDLSRPQGSRIVAMTLDGKPIDPNGRYRVMVNNFLASGGDGYSVLTERHRHVRRGARPRRAGDVAGDQSGSADRRPNPRPDAALARRPLARRAAPRHVHVARETMFSGVRPMRVAVFAACLLLAFPATAAQRQQLPMLSPAQAISRAAAASPKPVRAVFQFQVQSAAKTRDGFYLDSQKDFRSPANLGIAIRASAMPGLTKKYGADLKAALVGKTVKVIGEVRRLSVGKGRYRHRGAGRRDPRRPILSVS